MNVKNIPDLLSYGGEGKLIVNRDFKYSSNRACVILLGETIVVERPSGNRLTLQKDFSNAETIHFVMG